MDFTSEAFLFYARNSLKFKRIKLAEFNLHLSGLDFNWQVRFRHKKVGQV